MGKRNDMDRESDVDKIDKKSVSETIKAMFVVKDDGNSADKLKTQVKGYSVTAITERMLKKKKLGDAMTAVCNREELEEEIRENLKNGLPVYGFFRGKQMWSCFLFDKADIPRNELIPEPEGVKDTLCIYKIRKSYVHPDAESVYEDMMEVAHRNVYQTVLDAFGDGKTDGFMWKDRVYVCKRDKSTGIPYGFAIGIALGVAYGVLFDNLALGISLGVCFGMSFGMIWGTSTHSYVEHGMADGAGSGEDDSAADGARSGEGESVADGAESGENTDK